jgi:mRNA interferase MazF
MKRGEIWWADLEMPSGSVPGYSRPVLLVQNDLLNQSNLHTVQCVPFTTNLLLADMPGNVLVTKKESGLEKDSVIVTSQVFTLDKTQLRDKVGKLLNESMIRIDSGLRFSLNL